MNKKGKNANDILNFYVFFERLHFTSCIEWTFSVFNFWIVCKVHVFWDWSYLSLRFDATNFCGLLRKPKLYYLIHWINLLSPFNLNQIGHLIGCFKLHSSLENYLLNLLEYLPIFGTYLFLYGSFCFLFRCGQCISQRHWYGREWKWRTGKFI